PKIASPAKTHISIWLRVTTARTVSETSSDAPVASRMRAMSASYAPEMDLNPLKPTYITEAMSNKTRMKPIPSFPPIVHRMGHVPFRTNEPSGELLLVESSAEIE